MVSRKASLCPGDLTVQRLVDVPSVFSQNAVAASRKACGSPSISRVLLFFFFFFFLRELRRVLHRLPL